MKVILIFKLCLYYRAHLIMKSTKIYLLGIMKVQIPHSGLRIKGLMQPQVQSFLFTAMITR